MKEYHKIQTVFKRDMANKGKTLLMGEYSLPEFEFLKDCPWVFTEKVDGTNIRIIVEEGRVRFGGKTDNAQIPAFLVERLRTIFEPQNTLLQEMFPAGACLYGEGYGARIQKHGGNYGPGQDFVLFDVKVGTWWLDRHNVEDVGANLGVRITPIIGEGTLDELVHITRQGITSQWGDFAAEGIVARPKVELRTRKNERIITKLKTADFHP
jgi:RNA ligase